MSDQMIETTRRAIEAFNSTDRKEQYLELYSPDATLHGYAGVRPGLEGIREFYHAFWHAFPDAKVHIDDMFTSGDRLALRFHLTATHRGPFHGIPPTDTAIHFDGITILRFERDRCVERWSQSDFLSLLQQLGALPAV